MQYEAPLKDLRFAMRASGALDAILALPAYRELSIETLDAVLGEAGKFFADAVAPDNHTADKEGVRFDDGRVAVPAAIRNAWRQYAASGWAGLHAPEAFGGQGLPKVLAAAVCEMLNASNLALGSGLLLCDGAIEALLLAGSDEQKATFLPPLVSGAWSGTMNLTESQAGSDLAQIRTSAMPDGAHYRLRGQKIFITFGEHDITGNILHFVLARLPDAPAGVKGISLFVCPKFLTDETGAYTLRNDIRCLSIEHKLGIHASPTCVLSFGDEEGAVGYLIGKANKGLEYMFHMMNAARFTVGMQGIGIAERAYQSAAAYAKVRVQGTPAGASPAGPMPIIEHPDVRRQLLTMRAHIEASRAVALTIAAAIDAANGSHDPEERARQQHIAEFLVPVHKGHCSELSVEIASIAVQVHGGMGFVEETGVAQYYRDARILPIYEGTTAIQANDLVARKTLRDKGRVARDLISCVRSAASELKSSADEELSAAGSLLTDAVQRFEQALDWMLSRATENLPESFAAAVPYLRLTGFVLGGWQMARALQHAKRERTREHADTGFLDGKIAIAQFYLDAILPRTASLLFEVTRGSAQVLRMQAVSF
jgi:alkylation response protein AidB-like acyl-CoA dehydrogenase